MRFFGHILEINLVTGDWLLKDLRDHPYYKPPENCRVYPI